MTKSVPAALACTLVLACSQMVAPVAGAALREAACSGGEASADPWHVTNLYDCEADTLYVPYHLWTGMPWDGSKSGACMHEADTEFRVNGGSRTRITGPVSWRNPATGTTAAVWVRAKADGSKVQHFTCHAAGIGRVLDRRAGRADRHWATGRCKFPAGYGWKLGERRECDGTAIEITEVGLDSDGTLAHLTFKWWTGSTLDHVYRYEPERGMTRAWPQ